MASYNGIANYLRFLSETHNLDICINDFVGFLSIDSDLFLQMQPFYIHKNPYCMHIKSNRQLWDRCLNLKSKIREKAQRLKAPYYGMCFCGVGEFVVPILKDDYTIGVILAGEYASHKTASEYRIKKISQQYGMNYDTLIQKFNLSVKKEADDQNLIAHLLEIVADYFSVLYSSFNKAAERIVTNPLKHSKTENYILSHALEYITNNFCEKITLGDIANICHCSESYLSHIFKKNMKVNIKAYINKLRIDEAKLYLFNWEVSIAEIANRVGFADPNYFSTVFSELCGTSPTEYRKCITAVK